MAGRAGNVDESDFDDDAFEELPSKTLQELERDAFLSTQRPRAEDEDVVVFDDSRRGPEDASSDYGYEEDEVIDLNAEPISLPLAHNTYGKSANDKQQARQHVEQALKPLNGNGTSQHASVSAFDANGRDNADGGDFMSVEHDGHSGAGFDGLLAQVEELRKRNEELQRLSRESQTIAQTKAGEAALLRRRIDATNSEYEKRLQRMQDTHTEAFNKQKAQLDLAAREKRQIEDNNKFLEHDLRQVHATAAVRQSRAVVKEALANRSKSFENATTPRRFEKRLPFRDGFEDDEDVLIVSPSKSKQKPSTPRKGEKRKWSADHSPAQADALDFGEAAGSPAISSSREDSERSNTTYEELSIPGTDDRFDLMQNLLNHRPLLSSDDRLLEVLAGFAFPSQPGHKLSSVIIEKLQSIPTLASYPLEVVQVLSSIWAKCLEESFYAPVDALVETIQFLVSLQSLSFAAKLYSTVLPLIMKTVDLVAIPTGLAGKNSTALPAQAAAIDAQINSQQLLDLLDHVALGCSRAQLLGHKATAAPIGSGEVAEPEAFVESPIRGFWRTIQFDFVLLLLMRWQRLPAMRSVLRLLLTSCRPDTFGTISANAEGHFDMARQSKREDGIIHRLLDLLFETPKQIEGCGEPPCDELDLALLRLDVLHVFQAMCVVQSAARSYESHGARLLAHHPRAIGKLFRFLSDSISRLYIYSPPPMVYQRSEALGVASPHALTAEAINITVRILYYLITHFDKGIDVRQKLAAVPGGHHKHLVGLSRLAFSDQLVLDAGVEDAAVDAAHELLDNYLTYEEGESLLQVFSTPTSRGSVASGVSQPADARVDASEGAAQAKASTSDEEIGKPLE